MTASAKQKVLGHLISQDVAGGSKRDRDGGGGGGGGGGGLRGEGGGEHAVLYLEGRLSPSCCLTQLRAERLSAASIASPPLKENTQRLVLEDSLQKRKRSTSTCR